MSWEDVQTLKKKTVDLETAHCPNLENTGTWTNLLGHGDLLNKYYQVGVTTEASRQ